MLNPGLTVGRYRIDRVLGRGGTGTVCLGYDTELHRPVAIKILDDDTSSRAKVLREARNAAALSHPNICTIFEVGEANGSCFIAMEYLDGRSLRERIDDRSVSSDDALRFGMQAAEALAYAHQHGVVHRDIKAANAIVSNSGWLKIIDFGLARRDIEIGSQATTMHTSIPQGLTAGTPYSMAPEQVRGGSTGPASDVWGLGVLLCEMATGVKPFDGATSAEIFASVLRDEPSGLSSLFPAALQALIRRCLDKNPTSRAAAAEVRDGIKAILMEGQAGTRAAAVSSASSRTSAARPRVLVLPFANVSPDTGTDYFADGLTEELIADLSRVRSLLVISRASSMKLKSRAEDIRTLAASIGVDLILDGSVRKGKSSLRIAVQLVDAAIDCPIWAEKFTASDEDLLDLQERLSRQIIEALQMTLSKTEAEEVAMRPIADPRVYDIYLRARQKFRRFSAQELDEAVNLLQSGLELLKGNELLLATLGQAYVYYVHWGNRTDRRYLEEAQRCADEILRQRPESSHGHALCGALEMQRGNLQGAVRYLKKALRADPGNGEAATSLMYCYLTAGQPRSALPLIERMLEVDPLTGLWHAAHGWFHIDEGRAEEALQHYRRALDLDPGAPALRYLWGWALAQAGRFSEAAAYLGQFSRESPSSVLGELAGGFAHALNGDIEAARQAISPTTTLAGQYDQAIAHYLSQLYGLIGDAEQSSAWLEQGVKTGYLDYPEVMRDRCYHPVQSEQRFQNVMAELRRRWQAFEP
jgi:serine/threonine protein kinase/tetratricopeptide (TPR) repeat protein